MKPYVAFAALAVLAPLAAAQQQTAKPHPADPAAAVPAAKYESALTGYRGFREEPIASWKSVNDEVARAGGSPGIVADSHSGQGETGPAAKRAAQSPVGKK